MEVGRKCASFPRKEAQEEEMVSCKRIHISGMATLDPASQTSATGKANQEGAYL